MLTDVRRQRMSEVLDQRMVHVRCAIEAVHHRHNVSAILRTCDALGLHHVHLVADQHIKVVRGAAKGAERWLELHHHQTPEDAIRALREAGYAIWVADLADPPVAPSEVPVDKPLCLWLGAELVGVSEAARAAADGVVTLPMRGFAQSLNVSVAAALVLHEVADRAREAHGEAALLAPELRQQTLARWIRREQELKRGITARSTLDVDPDPPG